MHSSINAAPSKAALRQPDILSHLRPANAPVVSSRVFGMLLFVFVELMFFSALFSAYFVIKRGRDWSLPLAGHLPQAAAGFNSLVLLASSACLFIGSRGYDKHGDTRALRDWTLRAFILGLFFTLFQARLGYQLIADGLTMGSSIFGGCYFLLVGAHEVHALFGLIMMALLVFRGMREKLDSSLIQSILIYWLFVAGIWPVIYGEIYF